MFWEISLSLKSGYVTREEGIWESGRKREVVDALWTVFPQETQGQREISGQNFLQQDFYLLRFREKIWTMYLVVRLLDEGFHVVVPREALLCLGSAVCSEKPHAHCYYMEIRFSIFLSAKCFVHGISTLTGRQAICVVAGSYSPLLQRNTTIQSFTCMTISLLHKETQDISNELTLL